MENKFKVGDRVKWTKHGGSSWQNCTITAISPRFDGRMGYMLTDPHPEFGDGWIAEDELDLVAPTPESKALSLLRKIVDHGGGYANTYADAKAILDEVDPVDGDIAEARKICASFWLADEMRNKTMAGEIDDGKSVQAVLQAIKRGRELERYK